MEKQIEKVYQAMMNLPELNYPQEGMLKWATSANDQADKLAKGGELPPYDTYTSPYTEYMCTNTIQSSTAEPLQHEGKISDYIKSKLKRERGTDNNMHKDKSG